MSPGEKIQTFPEKFVTIPVVSFDMTDYNKINGVYPLLDLEEL